MSRPVTSRADACQRNRAVEKHDQTVGDCKDTREVVGDDHHAETAVGGGADQLADDVALPSAERGGRLVEQDPAAAPHCGAGHGNRLLLSAREGSDLDANGGELDLKLGKRLLGLARHLAPRDHPELAPPAAQGPLAAEEHVLEHRQVGREREVLVGRRDPEALGVADRVQIDALRVDLEVAGVGVLDATEALRERRLSRAVVAEDRDDLTPAKLERDLVESPDMPVDLADRPRRDNDLAGGIRRSRSSTTRHAARPRNSTNVCPHQTLFGVDTTLSQLPAQVNYMPCP